MRRTSWSSSRAAQVGCQEALGHHAGECVPVAERARRLNSAAGHPPLCLPGKLGKGGEPDLNTAAKMVLYDWQRGKIPFFTPPPEDPVGRPEKLSADLAEAVSGYILGCPPVCRKHC